MARELIRVVFFNQGPIRGERKLYQWALVRCLGITYVLVSPDTEDRLPLPGTPQRTVSPSTDPDEHDHKSSLIGRVRTHDAIQPARSLYGQNKYLCYVTATAVTPVNYSSSPSPIPANKASLTDHLCRHNIFILGWPNSPISDVAGEVMERFPKDGWPLVTRKQKNRSLPGGQGQSHGPRG